MSMETKNMKLEESGKWEWKDFMYQEVDFYTSGIEVLNNLNCGICVSSLEGDRILFANEEFCSCLNDDMTIKDELLIDIRDGESREVYLPRRDRWFDIHRREIQWLDQEKAELYTIYDITENKRYQKRIERQANNDFLTGLYNRMRCEKDLEVQIDISKRNGSEGALLYMDLDDFKHINDGLGHQYGDVLLKSISHSMQRINGIESNCYRMGGDEFIIIVTENKYEMLDKILKGIAEIFAKPWFLKGADYYCTMSMGIARFPADGDTVQDLIRKADLALLEAKKSGKNCYEFYTDSVKGVSSKRLDLEKNMRDATMNACNEFEREIRLYLSGRIYPACRISGAD